MLDFNSPLDAFLHWERTAPNQVFLNQPTATEAKRYTFKEVGVQARKVAQYIKNMEFPEKSHVALMSTNCAHWTMADLAIMMAGHISIPIYPTLDAKSIAQILEHSDSRLIILGKLTDFEKQHTSLGELPSISVELYGLQHGTSWESIIDSTNTLNDTDMAQPKSEDLHTIIYTSGTTGSPKGVMHTVGNFMNSTGQLLPTTELDFGKRVFSYLPMAHIAERLMETMTIIKGVEVFFAYSLETFASDLEKAEPHIFFGVPRIYAKFQEKILEKLPQKKLDTLLKIPIINNIIKKKLRAKLGLKSAHLVISGAAPLSIDVMDWYASIGIVVRQIYGMTEDGCVSHVNLPNANKVGTVGRAFEGVKVKFTQEGELYIKNNCLMKGYYKAPELTATVFDKDGYFKTGDKAEYDHEGYLTIIGRVKDEFKTDKGKYVSPAFLELELSKNTAIETICVVGTGIPQPIALVTLSEFGKKQSQEDLCKGFTDTLKQANKGFEKHEKIEKFVVMKEAWSVDNGLITPSLKVRRNALEKLHQPYYKDWFLLDDQVIFE